MARTELIRGDTVKVAATVKQDGSPVNINAGWTVKAALSSYVNKVRTLMGAVITCTDSDTGADWPNGVVGCVFPDSNTENWVTAKAAILEVEITDGSAEVTTWLFDDFEVVGDVIT